MCVRGVKGGPEWSKACSRVRVRVHFHLPCQLPWAQLPLPPSLLQGHHARVGAVYPCLAAGAVSIRRLRLQVQAAGGSWWGLLADSLLAAVMQSALHTNLALVAVAAGAAEARHADA